MRSATRVRSFADLVGTWKRQDALGARLGPNGGAVGVSYTDSGALEITAKGAFTLVKVHNHCSGSCCRMDGSEEKGNCFACVGENGVSDPEWQQVDRRRLPGSKTTQLDKSSSRNGRMVNRPNPNNNATTLCLNTGPTKPSVTKSSEVIYSTVTDFARFRG
jgi:hypothetical protein